MQRVMLILALCLMLAAMAHQAWLPVTPCSHTYADLQPSLHAPDADADNDGDLNDAGIDLSIPSCTVSVYPASAAYHSDSGQGPPEQRRIRLTPIYREIYVPPQAA